MPRSRSSLLPCPASIPGTTACPIDASDVVDYVAPREGIPDVVETSEALAAAARALAGGSGPVAVDAERASGFRYGQDAYLIQVRRAGAGTFLIDPTTSGDMSPLGTALAGAEWIFHAADQDLPCLAELGLAPDSLFDTELAARLLGRQRVGLGAVVEETLGLRLAKDHAAADWSTRPLPQSWLIYAALDVELLIELRAALGDELAEAGRSHWVAQECEFVRTRPPKPARPEPWRKTPGAGRAQRSRRSLAVLRELWLAREELAREADVTPSRVLPHSALVAAAVTCPTSRHKLFALKEFSSRQARLNRTVWWKAVERALALPEEDLPSRHAPLAPGELPQPRTWHRHHSHAAHVLDAVRQAVRTHAEQVGVPQELLLFPQLQRRLAWEIGEELAHGIRPVLSVRAVAERLETWEARPWQVEQVSAALAQTLAHAIV